MIQISASEVWWVTLVPMAPARVELREIPMGRRTENDWDPGPRSLWILFWILFSALDSKISKFHVIRTPHLRGPCITRAALQLVDPSLVSVLNSQMNMWPLISQGVDCLHCLDIVYIVYIIMNFRQEPHAKLSDASAASPAGLERSGATNCNELPWTTA